MRSSRFCLPSISSMPSMRERFERVATGEAPRGTDILRPPHPRSGFTGGMRMSVPGSGRDDTARAAAGC